MGKKRRDFASADYTASQLNDMVKEILRQLGPDGPEMVIQGDVKMSVCERYLKPLTTTTISSTSGTKTLVKAADVFYYIDPDFKNWGLDVAEEPTEEVEVQVLEIAKNGTFREICGSVGSDLDKLCLTQGQIKIFCQEHADLLRSGGYATFFLFKVGEQFFVASIYRPADGRLHVYVYSIENSSVWNDVYRNRLVLLQR